MGAMLRDLGRAPEVFGAFVETGTFHGHTTALAAQLFRIVYTIELSEQLFHETKDRLNHFRNVRFIHGNSASEIAGLCKRIDEPAVFFLDAHYSGGQTAFGEKEVPLYEELTEIAARSQSDLIIIDDYRLFGRAGISGSEGNDLYPPAQFDWRDITLECCLDLFRIQKCRVEYLLHDDRVYILTFPAVLEGSNIKTRSMDDLGIGKPHPILASFPPSTRTSTIVTALEPASATSAEGFTFDSIYGAGVAVTPAPMREFRLELDVALVSSRNYEVWVLYAAAEPRPVEFYVDGRCVSKFVAGRTTGGWFEMHQRWEYVGSVEPSAGTHRISIRRSSGWFPHIGRIALVADYEPP